MPDLLLNSKPGRSAGQNNDPIGPGFCLGIVNYIRFRGAVFVSALQEQSASARGTFAARVSALQAQSASAALGVKLGLSTPQAIPAAATNFSNVIICYSPQAAARRRTHRGEALKRCNCLRFLLTLKRPIGGTWANTYSGI